MLFHGESLWIFLGHPSGQRMQVQAFIFTIYENYPQERILLNLMRSLKQNSADPVKAYYTCYLLTANL